MLPEPQSPRTGLALSDLQSTSAGGSYAIGGGGISGLAISSTQGSSSWSTRGVGGIGAGIFDQSGIGASSSGGIFGGGNTGNNNNENNGSGVVRLLQQQLQLYIGELWPLTEIMYFSQMPSSVALSATLFLLLLASTTTICAAEPLPPCDEIPKLLCCTGRVLEKCLAGCVDYVNAKCPHKLFKYDMIDAAKTASASESSKSASAEATTAPPTLATTTKSHKVEPIRRAQPSTGVRGIGIPGGAKARAAVSGIAPAPSGNRASSFSELPEEEGFIEQSPPPSPRSGGRGRFKSGTVRSGGDYDQLNAQYPVTEVTDADLSPECGTAQSKPPFSPCLSRKSVDDLFLSCCKQHVPSSCHALCTYEHREHVAAETLIAAVQSDGCDLRHLSSILYCANQNRDNRECCDHLSLASSALGVGERCLRMCNVARSGQTVGTVEKNDLVCLSNWNVIMYCARAGLRTIN
uniref:DB domain-containing protein n=1 Tax=Panagrellus redivivus TaxID=6233 RepID=A0A7E4V0L9_PANRE